FLHWKNLRGRGKQVEPVMRAHHRSLQQLPVEPLWVANQIDDAQALLRIHQDRRHTELNIEIEKDRLYRLPAPADCTGALHNQACGSDPAATLKEADDYALFDIVDHEHRPPLAGHVIDCP